MANLFVSLQACLAQGLSLASVVALMVGFGAIAPHPAQAANSIQTELEDFVLDDFVQPLPSPAVVSPTSVELTLKDGIYVYGETDQPDQLGVTYTVFELKDRRVTGAVYSPHSSFDCFNGMLRDRQLALNVVDSYTRTSYTHAIALSMDTVVAANGMPSGVVEVGLLGMNRMAEVSANDRHLLAVCQAKL